MKFSSFMVGPVELFVIILVVLMGFVVPLIVLGFIVSKQAKRRQKQLEAEAKAKAEKDLAATEGD